jgi:alpha-galactosidase
MFRDYAQTPPKGWNSWDSFGASVTEAEVLGNAEVMAKSLKDYGWEYIVVDIQWYEPLLIPVPIIRSPNFARTNIAG